MDCQYFITFFTLQIFIVNLGKTHSVDVNKKAIQNSVQLKHRDVFTIIDRSFRLEIPEGVTTPKASSIKSKSPLKQKTPMMSSSSRKDSPAENTKILSPKVSVS